MNNETEMKYSMIKFMCYICSDQMKIQLSRQLSYEIA